MPLPVPLFHYDRGLKITLPDLAVDIQRRQPRGFISHAHNDHMARHEYALCTPETSRLYQLRLGKRLVQELPYRQACEFGGVELATYPAGHCLGSAMLLVTAGGRRILYTGDFKLGPMLTAAEADVPRADFLIMESTYGDPQYRHPPRDGVIDQLLDVVRTALANGCPPVIQAYTLGKAQEVTKILTQHGVPVLQDRDVFAISQVYAACGVDLGNYSLFPGYWRPGHAVVIPPRFHKSGSVPILKREVRIAVTGWAAHESTARRWGVHHCLPLSDHADFDELLEAIARAGPQYVICTHGPRSFLDHVQAAGYKAFALEAPETWPRWE